MMGESEVLTAVVNGELWAGWLRCRHCDEEWVDTAQWGERAEIICPKCGREAYKLFTPAEDAVARIATALIDVLRMPAETASELIAGPIAEALSDDLRDQVKDASGRLFLGPVVVA